MRKRINLAFQAPISRFTLHKELTRTGAWVLTTKASCDNEEFQLKLPMAGGMRMLHHNVFSSPLDSQKRLTCNFSLEHPYIIQQSSNKKTQTHQAEVFIMI